MPVTSDSAKVHFTLGSFDIDTTLTIPPTAAEDSLSLRIDEIISSQLSGWGTEPTLTIYGLTRITFEGQEIYKNAEFDSPSEDNPPVNPDLTIEPDSSPATVEVTTINRYESLITESDGTLSSGEYSVEIKFVFKLTALLWETEDLTTFTATFDNPTQKAIDLTTFYNEFTPYLTVDDIQGYESGDYDLTTNTEFELIPPENRTEVLNTFVDVQDITYTTFFYGGNEVNYVTLVSLESTTAVVEYANKQYKPFTVYRVVFCDLVGCLDTLYDNATAASCNISTTEFWEGELVKATSLVQQIQLAASCSDAKVSELVDKLNKVLGCDCVFLDATPAQVGAANIVLNDDIQIVNTSTAITVVDPSLGSTIYLNVDVSGDTTELQLNPIEANANYTFIIKNDSQNATQTVTFESGVFTDATGDLNDAVATANLVIVKVLATDNTAISLVSRNDV